MRLPFGAGRASGLFLQILDWMLVPLVVLWPLTVVVTYFSASTIADATFDTQLREMTSAVAEEARVDARSTRPLAVLSALRNDPVERMWVQIAGDDGAVLAGDYTLPRPAGNSETVRLRDEMVEGQRLRIASMAVREKAGSLLHVQVGEPIERRRTLVGNVTALVIGMVTLVVPVMVGLVWFGLWRGLRPVRELRRRIEARSADDLSPIPEGEAPSELAPLVESLNVQLNRVQGHIDAQRRFVADAAHQLRTPLAGLKAQADAAMREATLGEARARLARIEESADRLSRLVTQLLSLARADDAASRSPPVERVEMNGLLREVCAGAAEQAVTRQISLGFDAAEAPVEVAGSPLLLRELFSNLVDNAIRYTPPGGEVTVHVQAQPAQVTIVDTGSGIPESERERVFERFHRVLGTQASGSGLGLAIVRTIADLHRATVRAEPASGDGGTRFVVAFPA